MGRARTFSIWAAALLLAGFTSARAEGIDPRLVGVWSATPPGTAAAEALVFEVAPDGQYRMVAGNGTGTPQVVHGVLVASDGRWASKDELGRSNGGTYEFLTNDTLELDGAGGTATWYRTPIVAPQAAVVEQPQVIETVVVEPPPVVAFDDFDYGLCCYCCNRFDDAAWWFHRSACLGLPRACCQYGWCCERGCGVCCDGDVACQWYQRAVNGGCVRAAPRTTVAVQPTSRPALAPPTTTTQPRTAATFGGRSATSSPSGTVWGNRTAQPRTQGYAQPPTPRPTTRKQEAPVVQAPPSTSSLGGGNGPSTTSHSSSGSHRKHHR